MGRPERESHSWNCSQAQKPRHCTESHVNDAASARAPQNEQCSRKTALGPAHAGEVLEPEPRRDGQRKSAGGRNRSQAQNRSGTQAGGVTRSRTQPTPAKAETPTHATAVSTGAARRQIRRSTCSRRRTPGKRLDCAQGSSRTTESRPLPGGQRCKQQDPGGKPGPTNDKRSNVDMHTTTMHIMRTRTREAPRAPA